MESSRVKHAEYDELAGRVVELIAHVDILPVLKWNDVAEPYTVVVAGINVQRVTNEQPSVQCLIHAVVKRVIESIAERYGWFDSHIDAVAGSVSIRKPELVCDCYAVC